jgi:hypothetical protein
MDMKKYQTDIEIDVVPMYHASAPEIMYGFDHDLVRVELTQPVVLRFNDSLTAGTHSVIIDFVNKTDADCVPDQGLDKYITIGAIRINGLHLPRFNWLATYEPVFPEPWHSQQNPRPNPVQAGETHLGWNGRWCLQFDAPVFSWIHQIENMGWVWPAN